MRADGGSAAAEFVLVGSLLTVLILTVLQLGLALHVRNTVLDAASEGARFGALAGAGAGAAATRTRELIVAALGEDYARGVSARIGELNGQPTTIVTARTPLPLLGLLGFEGGLEVRGHAAVEIAG